LAGDSAAKATGCRHGAPIDLFGLRTLLRVADWLPLLYLTGFTLLPNSRLAVSRDLQATRPGYTSLSDWLFTYTTC
jgi:hypothetical protein